MPTMYNTTYFIAELLILFDLSRGKFRLASRKSELVNFSICFIFKSISQQLLGIGVVARARLTELTQHDPHVVDRGIFLVEGGVIIQ